MKPAHVPWLSCVLALLAVGALALAVPVHGQRAPRERAQVRITAGGDLLLHIKVVKAAEHHGWARTVESLAPLIRADEIAFANLETPLVNDVNEVVTGSPPVLGAPSAAAQALADAGFDLMGCANNHAYDQKAIGLARTIAAVRAAGMRCVGAAATEDDAYEPTIVTKNGKRVAFIGISQRLNRGPGSPEPEAFVARMEEDERVLRAIARARERADLVVVAVHWSHDFHDHPSWSQRRRAQRWVEAGVDLILGTGPHVLQTVTRAESERGDAVVAYSLGNLLSNQGQRWQPRRSLSPAAHPAVRLPETRDGALLRVTFEWRDDKLVASPLQAVPLWTENNFWTWWFDRDQPHDIRVRALASVDEAVRAARVGPIQEALGDAVTLVDPSP
ncbi:MAG: CapA family protein [Deltaproteobacteria bacterium]|nr:CapA family protein [Deltaproteobacteria bacterium]